MMETVKLIFPHTVSRRVVLHPATAADRKTFVQTILRAGLGIDHHAARPPTPDTMPSAVFIVTHRARNEVLGFSTLYGLSPAGYIHSGVYLDPQRARLGVGTEAVALSVNYAFATLNIDKVITSTTEASFGGFKVVDAGPQNGVLRDHVYFRGQPWDLYCFEVKRCDWEDPIGEVVDWALSPG